MYVFFLFWEMKGEMKMDFGVTSKPWEYGIGSHTSTMKEKNADGSFAEIAAAKAAEKEDRKSVV